MEFCASFSVTVKRILFVVFFFFEAVFHVQASNQTLLMSQLFSNYDRSVRPDCQQGQGPIVVYLGMSVRQVIELDEPKQILYLSSWIRLKWTDCNLQWNSSEYDNITNLILPFDKVWTPDITLYDSVETDLDAIRGYRVSVNSDGTVNYNFPYRIASMCNVDVTYFPFDTQTCPLQFGSWAYHGFDLDIQNSSAIGDISSFVPSSEFHLVKVSLERHELYYACCPEPYPDVTFYVILERKPTFYTLNLLFPCVLITSVAMLGFVLPPDAGEKIGLEITVLLSLAVFQLVVSDSLPPSSESFPHIGIYFACSMVLVLISTIMTVVVLNFHHKECKQLPKWMRVLFLHYLARVVCYGKPPPATVGPNGEDNGLENGDRHFGKEHSHLNGGRHFEMNQTKDTHGAENAPRRLAPLVHPPASEVPAQDMAETIKILKEQLFLMKQAEERKEQKSDHDHQRSEWKKLAIVLDRLFLIAFALSSLITALAVLVPLASQ